MAEEKLTFEEALKKLEAIVAEMESGDLALEAMLGDFEKGRELVAFLTAELEGIRQRIEKVTAANAVEPLNLK